MQVADLTNLLHIFLSFLIFLKFSFLIFNIKLHKIWFIRFEQNTPYIYHNYINLYFNL